MLRRSAVLACLLALPSCRTSLEETPDADTSGGRVCKVSAVAACMEAETRSDLAWIEINVFKPSCAFSGCHNGAATTAGRIDMMTLGNSHADLVNVDSMIEPGVKLVVPGQPRQSYLLMMMQQFKPAEMEPAPVSEPSNEVGYMPQGTDNVPLCCQKLDAVERWIAEGAMP